VVLSLIVSVIMAATQASDPSLGFVPKWLVVLFVLFLSRDMLTTQLLSFSARMLHGIGTLGR
jgi:flagellar biosynthesis protein FliQ